MRFLIDAQLPPKLAAWLCARGHDAEHVADKLGASTPDTEIIAHARAGVMVIVTKDADFAALVDNPPPQILWVRTGNVRTPQLLRRFEIAWPQIVGGLSDGSAIIDVE